MPPLLHPIRTILAAPHSAEREALRAWLLQEPDVLLVAEAPDGPTALRSIVRLKPDLALLYVDLPRLDGFGVSEAMAKRARRPAVVLLGARPGDAVRAFGAGASDFVPIPFEVTRLGKALERIRQQAPTRALALRLPQPTQDSDLERMALPVGGRLLMIHLNDLLWIRAARRQSELHMRDGVLLADIAFGRLEQKLPRRRFLQLNRSVIVRHDFVREARPKSHGDHWVVLEDGEETVLSRNRRQGVLRQLGWG